MTPLELFIVLLGASFVGGVRVARGSGSVWGLSSGVEYLVLGVILGPRLLGVVGPGAVQDFEALLLMGLAWLFALRGLSFGVVEGQRAGGLHLLGSVVASALCAAAVYCATRFVARTWDLPDWHSLALGLAAVSTESASSRSEDQGAPSSNPWLRGTELVPVLCLGAMALGAPLIPHLPLAGLQGIGLSATLGLVLGLVVIALLGAHFEKAEVWPLLLGSVLLVTGTALRASLPVAVPAFFLGLTVALSRHRGEIRSLVQMTERQLLLPCLLLAGLALAWPRTLREWAVVGAAIFARFLFKGAQGMLVRTRDEEQPQPTIARRDLLRASGFTIVIGLVVFLRQSAELGSAILTAAVLNVVLGELLTARAGAAAPHEAPQPSALDQPNDEEAT